MEDYVNYGKLSDELETLLEGRNGIVCQKRNIVKKVVKALRDLDEYKASFIESDKVNYSEVGTIVRYFIEFDGFIGTVIGSYTTLEGKEGVVLQQDGTRVVHVYGLKHLKPAPVAANASAEARLREAFSRYLDEQIAKTSVLQKNAYAAGNDRKGEKYHAVHCALAEVQMEFETLSAHPHASDCDKHGE